MAPTRLAAHGFRVWMGGAPGQPGGQPPPAVSANGPPMHAADALEAASATRA